jgi:hypothetical protein
MIYLISEYWMTDEVKKAGNPVYYIFSKILFLYFQIGKTGGLLTFGLTL